MSHGGGGPDHGDRVTYPCDKCGSRFTKVVGKSEFTRDFCDECRGDFAAIHDFIVNQQRIRSDEFRTLFIDAVEEAGYETWVADRLNIVYVYEDPTDDVYVGNHSNTVYIHK